VPAEASWAINIVRDLLRVEWQLEYDNVLTALAEAEVPVSEATGPNQQWTSRFGATGDPTLQPLNAAVRS